MSDSYQASWQPSSPQAETGLAAQAQEPPVPLPVMEREMVELHQNIESLLPAQRSKAIQFISSGTGEGVSTIVREYAWMAACMLGKSVLIIDGNRNHGQREYFNIANRYGWDDALRDHAAIDPALTRIGQSTLYLSCTSQYQPGKWHAYDPHVVKDFFDGLKSRFDITLFDSPSLAHAPDSAALARSVDGVVIVVEADKTRWPVVATAKKKIVNKGGTIVGIVLNKRQNHIPEPIYSRL